MQSGDVWCVAEERDERLRCMMIGRDAWCAAEMRGVRLRCVTWSREVTLCNKVKAEGKVCERERERERERECVCVIKWPKAKCEARLVTMAMWPEAWHEDCDKIEVKAKCEAKSEKWSEIKWWTFSNTVLSHRWGKRWKRRAEAKPDCRLYWDKMKFEVHEFRELDSFFFL